MAAVRETAIATVRLAIATVGTVTVGVPVAAVLQALPLAGALHPLPRRQGALCGVAEHAGALVPVVDLARWVDVGEVLNNAPARDKTARILVLGDGRRSIGLRVDAVVGMTDVPAPTRVLHDQDPDEVFDSVVKSDELERVVSVLDVARMIALAGAWHGGDDSDSTAGGADHAGPDGDGDSGADGAAALLAQGAGVTANTATLYELLAIVEHGDLALGLMVRAALELRMLAVPVTPAGAAVATTVIGEDGAAIEVIDTAALLARVPEASISRATAPAGGAATAQRLNSHAYIVFQTDQHHATAIDAIEEILALAAVHVDAHEQLLPTIAWRGQPLPLTDLRPPGTPTPPGCGARIIVARSPDGADAGCTGYVVKQVVLLIPPNTGKLYRMALAGVGLVEFITTGAATEQASYRTMDLARRTTTARLSR